IPNLHYEELFDDDSEDSDSDNSESLIYNHQILAATNLNEDSSYNYQIIKTI
ncbi:9793_t:CDS:1, partial [Scutellospora calospora]